jgi:hypothetical protein
VLTAGPRKPVEIIVELNEPELDAISGGVAVEMTVLPRRPRDQPR